MKKPFDLLVVAKVLRIHEETTKNFVKTRPEFQLLKERAIARRSLIVPTNSKGDPVGLQNALSNQKLFKK